MVKDLDFVTWLSKLKPHGGYCFVFFMYPFIFNVIV